MSKKDYFSGIEKTDVVTRNPQFKEGTYVVQIKSAKIFEARDTKFPTVIVDVEVVSSSNPSNHPVGSMAALFTQKNKYADYFFKDTKAIIGAAFKSNPNEVTDEVAAFAFTDNGTDSELVGNFVKVSSVFNEDKPDYPKRYYSPVNEKELEALAS